MSKLIKPSGHYAVVDWEYGSEEGRIEMDGIKTKRQALLAAYQVIWRNYRIPWKKVIIKGVYHAGPAQRVFTETSGRIDDRDNPPFLPPSDGDRPRG